MTKFENQIIHDSCVTGLQELPLDFIDLTVTSPPYNVDLGNNKHNKTFAYDSYDDNKPYQEYLDFLTSVFTPIYEKTVSGGRCVINIGDLKNGRVPTHVDISLLMREIGWLPFTTIVWDKRNTVSRTAWGSFQSPSSPSFPTPFEYILVFSKDSHKLQKKGVTDLTKQEFIDWSLALWHFPGEKRSRTNHPAPFPIELPMRCIKMFSWVGDMVFDPFSGSGTTACASVMTGRRYLGFDTSEEYVSDSLNRLATIERSELSGTV